MKHIENECLNEEYSPCLGVRRVYDEDDAFFDEGNILRYSKFVVESSSSSSSTKHLNTLIDSVAKPLQLSDGCIECNFPGCYERFATIPSFNAHYNVHTCHCLSCNAICPNQRLLDIHISESHSSYFQAQASRKPSYICIVESCPELFWTADQRSEHLRLVHKFSSNYSFISRASTKTQQKKAQKTKNNKKDPSKIICKFVKSGQICPKGVKCKFLHPESVACEESKMQCADDEESDHQRLTSNDVEEGKKQKLIKTQSRDQASSDSLQSSVSALMDRLDQISLGQLSSMANSKGGGMNRKQRLKL